jgi:hypothetical protein
MPTPYQPSGSVSYLSRFPFASRPRQEDVPLFQGFEQEDDETQHERDMADYLALQKSRRNFIPSHLTESSEMEDHNLDSSILASRASLSASKQKSAMVDVELGSTDNDDAYSDFDSIDRELDARPPAFLQYLLQHLSFFHKRQTRNRPMLIQGRLVRTPTMCQQPSSYQHKRHRGMTCSGPSYTRSASLACLRLSS